MAHQAPVNLRGVRWWPLLAAWAAAIGGLVGALSQLLSSEVRMASILVGLGGIFAATIVHGWKLWRTARTVVLRADAEGLTGDGKLLARRDRIVSAFYEPANDEDPEARVTLRMRRQRDLVFVVSPSDAGPILKSLGLDAAHARTDFSATPLPLSSGGWAMLFIFGMTLAAYAIGAVAASGWWAPFLLLPLGVVPRKIHVGTDGVALSWLGLRRFVSYAQIRAVRALPEGVGLELVNGQTVFVRTAGLRESREGTVQRGAFLDHPYTIAARVDEALRAYVVSRAAEDPNVLAPAGDDLAGWVGRMRLLGKGEGTAYRSAAVSREALWRIAESASAAPAARTGAVLALGASLDPEEKRRLRVTVDTVVEPRVRVALEKAAEGDDEAVVEALKALKTG